MIKYTVKYNDYFDNTEQEAIVYFHLNRDEMLNFMKDHVIPELGTIDSIEERQDALAGYQLVYDLVLNAYGERSADGKRFMKSDEITRNLTESPILDAVVDQISESKESMLKFISGVIPPKLLKEAQERSGGTLG